MRSHPYLRAYMAGIVTPTLFLLVIMGADAVQLSLRGSGIGGGDAATGGGVMTQIERALVFPMAVVPNLWGVWNVLYLAIHSRAPRWPLAVHGMLLVLLIFPAGYTLAVSLRLLEPVAIPVLFVPLTIGMAIYYLAWKFVVGFLNRELGIA